MKTITINKGKIYISDRIAVFKLEDDGSITVKEMCDEYFKKTLTKSDMDSLIEGLQDMRKEMK